jgi:hypothetical protein
MPPTTASQKPTKLTGTNGAASAAAPAASSTHHDDVSGKPDDKKYHDEQDALNKEIAAIKTKLVSLVCTCRWCMLRYIALCWGCSRSWSSVPVHRRYRRRHDRPNP